MICYSKWGEFQMIQMRWIPGAWRSYTFFDAPNLWSLARLSRTSRTTSKIHWKIWKSMHVVFAHFPSQSASKLSCSLVIPTTRPHIGHAEQTLRDFGAWLRSAPVGPGGKRFVIAGNHDFWLEDSPGGFGWQVSLLRVAGKEGKMRWIPGRTGEIS